MPTILTIDELKDEYIIKMRFAIKTSHPQIIFEDEVESINNSRQLVVTQRSYELKQIELKYLLDVEIPINSKEIGIAMEKGDLSENVISYSSPIGEILLNKAVGDSIDLGTKNNKKRYKILKIEKAIF